MYSRSLPRDYEEATLADGCTRFEALRRIVLPLAAPGLAAIGAFSFLFSYDEILFALLTTSSLNSKTMPVMIATISMNSDDNYTLIHDSIVRTILTSINRSIIYYPHTTFGRFCFL